jgi:hypothetical protein
MNSSSNRCSTKATVLASAAVTTLAFVVLQMGWPLALSRPAEAGTDSGDSPAQSSALTELNADFRKAYARSRQDLLCRSGPVLLVEGDDLVLLRNGRRSQVKVIPELYHTLKAVSHVPLAIYVLLAAPTDGPIDEQRLADLRSYRERIVQASKYLESREISKDVLQRQAKILTGSLKFLDGVLENKATESGALSAFTREMATPVLANASDAARAQLDGMHKQVQSWKAEMPADEWKKLHMVIEGSALPRKGNLSKQYFARLLGEPEEGPRIVYAEALFDETRALHLLGTHLLDTDIGSAFFDDPQRMHRDLLADAAADYLKQMHFDP